MLPGLSSRTSLATIERGDSEGDAAQLHPQGLSGPSSCDLLLSQVMSELAGHGVTEEVVRVADHDSSPGVTSDEGDGDDWPALRRLVLDADVLVLGTPIWLGYPSASDAD